MYAESLCTSSAIRQLAKLSSLINHQELRRKYKFKQMYTLLLSGAAFLLFFTRLYKTSFPLQVHRRIAEIAAHILTPEIAGPEPDLIVVQRSHGWEFHVQI